MSIEDIILDRDRRGISALRSHLPADYCDQAARLILEHPGTAIIVTGFYILAARAPETDGPPGAIAIGNALQAIGHKVAYVTDRPCVPVTKAIAGPDTEVVDFPITGQEASKRFADDLLSRLEPSVVISIERCGATQDGAYLNMRGRDISSYTASVDHLFSGHPSTVGIGDGGNEIGMGNLASVIPTVSTLVEAPCATTVTKLVISSVSNWGGYGLVAALSRHTGKNLLPSVEEEQDLVRRLVDAGAVDGFSTKQEYRVDSFSLDENSQTVAGLQELLAREGVGA